MWGRTDICIPRVTSTPHPSIQPRPAQMAVTRYQPTDGCPQGYADWCLAREIVKTVKTYFYPVQFPRGLMASNHSDV